MDTIKAGLKTSIKYLGVEIVKNIDEIAQVNLNLKVKEMRKLLKSWNCLSLTFMGRVNIIKMAILPKFTFLFDVIPLEFKHQWLKAI